VANTDITIPGYEILLKIGEGATATVWRARQESLDRQVAIKVLKPQYVGNQEEVAAFLREARAVAKLKSHHIIQIYDVGQAGDVIYFVMEYIDGHTLSSLLDLGDPIAQPRALSIASAVAQALADAWNAEKIIHRDIKPGNIIIEKGGGGVKVADLGLAGIVDATGHLVGDNENIVGTPSYMSPEQASGNDAISFTSDMYSLGAVLYHMLTGKMPFSGQDLQDVLQAQIEDQLAFPQDVNPKVSTACAQLIARLMMKSPQGRYAKWENVITDIDRLADGKVAVMKPVAGTGSTIAAKGAAPRKHTVAGATGAAVRQGVRQGTRPANKIVTKRPPSVTIPARITPAADTAARVAALQEKYGKSSTPWWLRVPLTAALLALFGSLGYNLLYLPYQTAYGNPFQGSVTAAQPPASNTLLPTTAPRPDESLGSEPTDRLPNPPVNPINQPPEEEASGDGYTSDSDRTEGATEVVAEEVAKDPVDLSALQGRLNQLKESLIHVAIGGGLEKAAQDLQQQLQSAELADAKPQLDELSRFLTPANHPHALIADHFSKLVGHDTYVNIGGKRIDFRVDAVKGLNITAMVKTQSGSSTVMRPSELKVGQLEPDEQRRLLGDVNTPEKAFAVALLDLGSANYAEAAKRADQCGPLADATRAFAQRRVDMLLE